MAYYLRVFCASRESVAVADVVDWAASDGVSLRPESAPDESVDPRWQVTLWYAPGRSPLLLELDRDADAVAEEVEEFVGALGHPGLSRAKRKVLARLRVTQMVAAVQVPTADADNATYDAAGTLVRYFADKRDGLIQADGEGFYEGSRLIVRAE